MLTKKSRYKNALSFTPLADDTDVFPGIRARAIGSATGVVEHEIQAGDRLDQLARHYNDDRLWWVLSTPTPMLRSGSTSWRRCGRHRHFNSQRESKATE